MFEILRELPKCDTEVQSEQMLFKNGTGRLARHRVATNLQFVKNAISVKLNKAKNIKMRHDCKLF